jgi:hypothetical protein
MSKTRKRGITDRSSTTDVVSQLECAVRNPQAALLGAVIGGLVPWFGRTLAHEEIPGAWSTSPMLALAMLAVVLGCACFSGISVYKFGKAAFGDSRKALGFVCALEGVMLVSRGAIGIAALVVLVAINAIANGSVIALSRDATKRRCMADVRRAATRSRNARGDFRSPIESTAPTAPPIVWRRATLGEVIDAEIVSEEGLS